MRGSGAAVEASARYMDEPVGPDGEPDPDAEDTDVADGACVLW